MASQEEQRRASLPSVYPANYVTMERAIHDMEWNQDSLPLSTFVDKYQLPQMVQVDDGYYGDDDEGSLSTGQVLKVHCLKTTKKVVARDWHGHEMHIPLNTKHRVQRKPSNYLVSYRSVADLAQAKPTPRYVEASQGYYNVASDSTTELSIEPGDRLEVVAVESAGFLHSKKKPHGWVKFLNSAGVEVRLPFDCTAAFTPLVDLETHHLAHVVAISSLPVFVKFVNGDRTGGSREATAKQKIAKNEFAKLGVLKLECVYDEELVIASCGENNVKVIFTIPKNLQISVRTAMGCLKGDPIYANLCRTYNDFVDLEKKAVTRHNSEVFVSGRSSKVKGYRYVRETTLPPAGKEGDARQASLQHRTAILDEGDGNGNEDGQSHEYETPNYQRKLSGHFGFVAGKGDAQPSPYAIVAFDGSEEGSLGTVEEDRPGPGYTEDRDESVYPYLFGGKERRSLTTSDLPQKRRSGSFTEGVTSSGVPLPQNTSLDHADYAIPDDLATLDLDGVCRCLRKLNMARFEGDFRFHQVDGPLLLSLDDASLSDLGVGAFPRKKLVNFIGGWRPQPPSDTKTEK